MTSPALKRAQREQLKRDFPRVCDYFNFDANYRKTIWNWLERSHCAARFYRAIARTLEDA